MLNSTAPTSCTSQNLYDPFQVSDDPFGRYAEVAMFGNRCCGGYENIPPHEWIIAANENAANNLDLALRCAEAGLYVFPCNPADRKPLIKWRYGKDPPTTDPKLIRKWWGPKKWPRALIGIDLGKSGLFVIDADRHGGPDGVNAVARIFADNGASLNDAPTMRTPSDGRHHYYRQPESGEPLTNSDDRVRALGINVRGVGGIAYFGTRFTVHNTASKHYQQDPDTPDLLEALRSNTVPVVPEFFVKLLQQQPKASKAVVLRDDPFAYVGEREKAYAAKALHNVAEELSDTEIGYRNRKLYNCAFRLATMVARDWIGRELVEQELEKAAAACGYVEDDGRNAMRATIKSGIEGGLKWPHDDLHGASPLDAPTIEFVIKPKEKPHDNKKLPWIVELGSKLWGAASVSGNEYRSGRLVTTRTSPGGRP